MGMRQDVIDAKNELQVLKSNTVAMEILHEYKVSSSIAEKSSKRMFIIAMTIIVMFIGLLGYTIYILNDISQVTSTEVQQENESGNNNYIGRDGDINGETKGKNS